MSPFSIWIMALSLSTGLFHFAAGNQSLPAQLGGQHVELSQVMFLFSKIQISVVSSDAADSSPEQMVLLITGKCTLQPSCALPVQLLLSAIPVGYICDSCAFLQMLG